MDALEQSGNVRKACHSTWAGEGTVLSVAIGETSVSETNKEEGSVSSLFLLPMGVIALHCGMLTKYGRQRLMTVCETLSLSRTERFPLKRGLSAPLFYDNGKGIYKLFLSPSGIARNRLSAIRESVVV